LRDSIANKSQHNLQNKTILELNLIAINRVITNVHKVYEIWWIETWLNSNVINIELERKLWLNSNAINIELERKFNSMNQN